MMYAQDKQHVPDRVELKGILSEFRDALEEEIDKIKKSGQSSTLLFGGRQIESHGADLWYRFNVEYVPSLPADTPCKLVIGKDQFDVTVISYEENSIVISTKTTLPDTIGKARLENGATVLMERLIKCIVIFDLVIDEPHWKANLFMTDLQAAKAILAFMSMLKIFLYLIGAFRLPLGAGSMSTASIISAIKSGMISLMRHGESLLRIVLMNCLMS